jgi:SPP1 gp7 family putative phage head morphogenesis protein
MARDAAQRHLEQYLRRLVRRLRRLTQETLIPVLAEEDTSRIRRALAELEVLIAGAINEKALLRAIRRMLRTIQRLVREQIISELRKAGGTKTLAVSPLEHSPRIARALEQRLQESVALIKTIPKRYHARVAKAVREGLAQGKMTKAIAREIYEIGKSTMRRAELIARDQAGKGLAAIMEAQQRDLGLKKFRWVTSHDERVRPAHRRLDGKIFTWDRGAPISIEPARYPGMAPLCRCQAMPVYEELLTVLKRGQL